MKKRHRKLRLGRETLRALDAQVTRRAAGATGDMSWIESCYWPECMDIQEPLPPGTGPIETYPTVHNQTCPGVSAQVTVCALECPTELPNC